MVSKIKTEQEEELMLNSGIYSYINVLDKAIDASWIRNTVLNNNLANATTPGFKRQEVRFEENLEKELKKLGSVDSRVSNVNLSHLNYETYTDLSNYSYRLDGNNVDEAAEQAELASNQIKYQALVRALNSEFNRLKTAMTT